MTVNTALKRGGAAAVGILIVLSVQAQDQQPPPQPDAHQPQAPAQADAPDVLAAPADEPGQEGAAEQRPAETAAAEAQVTANGGIRLNFREVPVDVILDHLSRTAGFAVVKDVEVGGTIDMASHQPLTAAEAIELLNVALSEKGYAAIRTDRILRIVSRDAAKTYDLPVVRGADPEAIPRSDEMVTQIIPVRYADATKLLENLQPLLGSASTITANQSSNAVIITDTRTNVRRIASIIQALDTSIAMIAEIRVYPLRYADAEELARAVTTLFEQQAAASAARDPRERMRQTFMRMRGMERGEESAAADSEAKQAASRVRAVADKRSNSLIVAAPTEVLDTVTSLVEQLDVTVAAVSEVRVFPLQHADAAQLAQVINGIFEPTGADAQQTRTATRRVFVRGAATRGAPAEESGNRDAETRVKAVGDAHSNCVVVTAPPDVLATIAELVKQIDVPSEDSTVLRVFPLRYANAETVADSLNRLFDKEGAQETSRARSTDRRTIDRTRATRGGATQTTADRLLREAELTAVADTRTNAVIVSASENTLSMVADVVRELDDSPKNVPQVYVYKIRHADLQKLLTLLEGMFEDLETRTTTAPTGTTGTATINLRRRN